MPDADHLYNVIASELFENDLDNAARFRAQTSGKRSALKSLDKYEATVDRLENFPEYGPKLRERLRWCAIDDFNSGREKRRAGFFLHRLLDQKKLIRVSSNR